jgi:uncharacterized protein YqfA (UPF0365 family)
MNPPILLALTSTQWVILIVLLLFVLVFLGIFAQFASLWLQCKMTRAGIGLGDLVFMRFRRVNPALIVRSKIMAVQAGLNRKYPLSVQNLEAHALSGGNVPNVIRALIAADKASIPLDWNTAQAIDLAGRDILEAVTTSVYPKVIDCPDPKRNQGTLSAVAADGIELRVRARVTVRTNIRQLIGGATEETVIARVGQGIVQAIGSTPPINWSLKTPTTSPKPCSNRGLKHRRPTKSSLLTSPISMSVKTSEQN